MKRLYSEEEIIDLIKKLVNIPTPTTEDEGKVLGVDEDGKYALISIEEDEE